MRADGLNRSICVRSADGATAGCIGSDNRGHLRESPTTEPRAEVRQAAPVIVCQP